MFHPFQSIDFALKVRNISFDDIVTGGGGHQ